MNGKPIKKIRIESHRVGHKTKVFVDDVEQTSVRRVTFEADVDGVNLVTLSYIATEVEISGEAEVSGRCETCRRWLPGVGGGPWCTCPPLVQTGVIPAPLPEADETPLHALMTALEAAGIPYNPDRLNGNRDYYEVKQRQLAKKTK